MGELTIVRAGAGSGKTYDLCRTIAEHVASGLDPARILATTFTKKAAAELKSRIQQRLLEHEGLSPAGRLEKAERLELAVIGTMHSVGHQLLTRYALHLGLSPKLDVLDEQGSSRALDDLLGRSAHAQWNELADYTRRFSLEAPQEIMLDLLDAARCNRIGIEDIRADLKVSAERLCELMAPSGPRSMTGGFEELYKLAATLLIELNQIQDSTNDTEKARGKLRDLSNQRLHVWNNFLEAKKIKAGKNSGAEARLAPMRESGAGVLGMPELHTDVRNFVNLLCERAVALSSEYQQFKQQRGLVDFTDLETLLLRLLETPELAHSLAQEFDFVVVDEFQDTNPLQLAIFQHLRALSKRSRWVGDSKQAIYGFRGTDPTLTRMIWDAVPQECRHTLPKNFRSQAGLVQLVGKVFQSCFGEESLLQHARPGAPKGVERWLIDVKNATLECECLAIGIAQLNASEGLRLGDIAVLARTNEHAKNIGKSCSKLGLPVLLELPGLLATRECALVLAGLRLAADRSDSLAAAEIMHILSAPEVETPTWLEQRLEALKNAKESREQGDGNSGQNGACAPWDGEAWQQRIQAIPQSALSPSAIAQRVIDALEVGNRLRYWGNFARRLTNVDSFLALAQDYEAQALKHGAAATLSGLIAHLEDLAFREMDGARPPYGIDAVTILTYHRSKGLEWPVVILTDLNYGRDPDMWKPTVEEGTPRESDPLAGRKLRYWPWPFGRNPVNHFILNGSGLEVAALESTEGQRAALQQNEEAIRLLYVGFTRARDKLVLAHRPGNCDWLSLVPDINGILPPDLSAGEHKVQGLDTTYVVKQLTTGVAAQFIRVQAAEQVWLTSLNAPTPAPRYEARYHSPSHGDSSVVGVVKETEVLTDKNTHYPKADEVEFDKLGEGVHAYMASLLSHKELARDFREGVARRCLGGFDVGVWLTPPDLVEMGERFADWVAKRYSDGTWKTEVPIVAPRKGGGQWVGVIDLILVLSPNEVVVVDHKSSSIRQTQCGKKALEYASQLAAYREALLAQGIHVKEMWIHFPLAGAVTRIELAANPDIDRPCPS